MPSGRTSLTVLLLLLAAVQVFGCSLGCDLDDDSRPGHCLCCCRHLALPAMALPAPAESIEMIPLGVAPGRPSAPACQIHHPPKV